MGNETQRVHGCIESWRRTAVRALLARDAQAFQDELLCWSSLIADKVYSYKPRSYDEGMSMLRGELADMAGELCGDSLVPDDADFEAMHAWVDAQVYIVSDTVATEAHDALGIQYGRSE